MRLGKHALCDRRALTVGLVVGLVLAVGLGAVSQASVPSVNPNAGARACADGKPLSSQLGAAGVAYIARLVPCVVRQERLQLGLGFSQNRALSRSVKLLLLRFVKLNYLAEHNVRAAKAAVHSADVSVSRRVCAKARFDYAANFDDSAPPPVLTPLQIAKQLNSLFTGTYGKDAGRIKGARIGIASGRGLLFRGNDLHGVDFVVLIVHCL